MGWSAEIWHTIYFLLLSKYLLNYLLHQIHQTLLIYQANKFMKLLRPQKTSRLSAIRQKPPRTCLKKMLKKREQIKALGSGEIIR